MLDIEKVTMTVSQCCNEGKGSRNYPQLMKIWPPCRCGRENYIVHTIVSLALFVTSLQVYMMYRLHPKRDQLDKWVFQIKHLIPKFHGGRVLCVLCCSLCLDCICRIQKNFYLETRVWGPIIVKTKVDYNLATSLEIEDITCQRVDMRSLVKYFFSTWEEKFRISKRPCMLCSISYINTNEIPNRFT